MRKSVVVLAILGMCAMFTACSLPGERVREITYSIDEQGVEHVESIVEKDPETREILRRVDF